MITRSRWGGLKSFLGILRAMIGAWSLGCLLVGCFAGAAQTLAATDARADERDWHVTGYTQVRGEDYRMDGSPGTTVFTNTGDQCYQELQLVAVRRATPYDKLQLEFSGLWNNSLYRSRFWGGEVERVRLWQEKGDVHVPFRWELGDLYGNFSYRTLQRSLKGLQIEFQPRAGKRDQQSFLLVFGRGDPDWHDLEQDLDNTGGFSWMLQRQDAMKLGLNYVYNTREANTAFGTLDRQQSVWSLVFERQMRLFGQKAVLDAEAAFFNGDHDGTTGPASGQDRHDYGLYGELVGGGRPFSWRLRHETYGQDFRPAGGAVAPDRRATEGYFTWDLRRGRSTVVRLQRFQDGWETDNPRWTKIAGWSLRGPIGADQHLQGGLNAFIEDAHDRRGFTDHVVRSVVGDLNRTFSDRLSGHLVLSYRHLDSDVTNLQDNRVGQVTVGVDHSVRLGAMNGRASLEFDHRALDSGGEHSREWTPAVGLNLQDGPHDFGVFYRFARQDQETAGRLDVDTAQANARYQYHRGDHTVGIEYLVNRRQDSNGIWTRNTQLVGFYRYDFDTVFRTADRNLVATVATSGPVPLGPAVALTGDPLLGLVLGSRYAEAVASVARVVGAAPRTFAGLGIFDVVCFDDVPQRQRLVLVREGTRMPRASIVLDADAAAGGQVLDVLDRVRRSLVQRFGSPANLHERGAAGPNLGADIHAGLFIRNYDWNLPGGTLRLGLPRRLDGRVTVEVTYAASVPSIRDNAWGLERLD